MTDDEINKRVAEIEGFVEKRGIWESPDNYQDNWPWRSDDLPDFANDWQWCGPLVEKYKMAVGFTGADWVASYWYDMNSESAGTASDTPQRAICLAVIAAHEGK